MNTSNLEEPTITVEFPPESSLLFNYVQVIPQSHWKAFKKAHPQAAIVPEDPVYEAFQKWQAAEHQKK